MHSLIAGWLLVMLALAFPANAENPFPQMSSDIAEDYSVTKDFADYTWREEMIPMRDGVRLFTIIIMKKGAADAPILLSRTPYGAAGWARRNVSQSVLETVPVADRELLADGYIRVFQDVRGRFGSEGNYVVTRPLRGPINRTETDHATDAYDTIDWLVKNVTESNGHVGMNGSSYPGFLALMATVDPHPALKAVIAMSPMVDGWRGDDWFHNGAFRQSTFDFMAWVTASKGMGSLVPMGQRDQYREFLDTGSAGDFARKWELDQLPFIRKVMDNPAYNEWWKLQAVDRLLAGRELTVPTMLVIGQWDTEDSYGAPAVYKALEPSDVRNDQIFYVIGPWRHSGVLHDGSALGPLKFPGDTAREFRVKVQKPFLDARLRPDTQPADIPPVLTFATGANEWRERNVWPAGIPTPYFLAEGGALSPEKPLRAGSDQYLSDPANPVPFMQRPASFFGSDRWHTWMLADQRFVDGRPDVLTYVTPPLEQAIEIAGQPRVDLFAATSGSDSDWIVKLIDVYPPEIAHEPMMAGYQLPVSMEIFRGRYVDSFAKPRALTPGKVERYRFDLTDVNHVFRPGHRIMVQIQSSLFPLYDRNPQTYVDNIFHARSEDYRISTQQILSGPQAPSSIWLPITSPEN
ncbi:MAG: CocE/NonD family hydrolase [Pseudomonadota bacterium]